MESEWSEFTVSDLVKEGVLEKPLDGNHGGIHPKSSDYVSEGIPFVMASDMIGGRVDTKNCKFISKEQAETLRKGFAKEGDVLLSHKATIGRTAIVEETADDYVMLTPQVTYYRVADRDRLHNVYLRYYFDSAPFQELFNQWAGGGSTRAYLGITGQLKLPIVVPPLPEQKAIAHILGTLDDKIELNRRLNATLEGMAQALFKSWFVDFDPVIDNALAAGNPIPDELASRARLRQGYDGQAEVRKQALANSNTQQGSVNHPTLSDPKSLFPATFQFTDELGPIPEGWRVGKAKDFCSNVQNGGTPNRSENSFWEGGTIPWLASGEVRQPIIIETGQHITDSGFESSSAKWNPRWTTVVALYGATAGQTSLLSKELTTNQAVCALIPKEDCRFYNYLNFRNRTSELEDKAVGSAQQNLSKGLVESVSQLDPGAELLAAFDSAALPMFEKRISNLVQSQSLTKLRDTLLPKLISGEIGAHNSHK